MINFLSKFLVIFFLFMLTSCMQEGFTSKPRPIGITNKKAKAIQAKRFKPHEIHRYDRQSVSWGMISTNKSRKYSPMESKRYSVNNNSKNRKINKQMVAKKRKNDNNYRYYRDSMEAHQAAEKSNFSIYDK